MRAGRHLECPHGQVGLALPSDYYASGSDIWHELGEGVLYQYRFYQKVWWHDLGLFPVILITCQPPYTHLRTLIFVIAWRHWVVVPY